MAIMNDPERQAEHQARVERLKAEARLAKENPYTPTMADMVDDDVRAARGLPPRQRPPLMGIRDMDDRIMELTAQKARLLDTLDDCPDHLRQDLEAHLNKLNAEIQNAQDRLAEYKKQYFQK